MGDMTATSAGNASHGDTLPPGWQEMVSGEGTTYYTNHATRTTTFTRPEYRTIDIELPPRWEILRTSYGVAYFADHNTRTTTFEDPRVV